MMVKLRLQYQFFTFLKARLNQFIWKYIVILIWEVGKNIKNTNFYEVECPSQIK